MTGFPFFIFAAVVVILVYLHFFLAHREWRRSRGKASYGIDPDYVRAEDFLGQSFRLKLKEWLQLPSSGETGEEGRRIIRGRERILVSGPLHYRQGSRVEEVLAVEQEFTCGPDCTFTREIQALRDSRIGAGSRLQAIAADGRLLLERSVRVARWVDSAGELEMGEGCQVGGRATSRTAIYLTPGAQAASLYAPRVATQKGPEPKGCAEFRRSMQAVEIPPPLQPSSSASRGTYDFDLLKLYRLSPECWLYDGDLELAAPLLSKTKLVVRGNCSCPAGSVLEGDIKVTGSLRIGHSSVCKGNLVAGGSIYLGPRSQFQGVIHAGKTLWLAWGVRGSRPGGQVAAYAADALSVEPNVVIEGKLASGTWVMAVPPALAEPPAEQQAPADSKVAVARR